MSGGGSDGTGDFGARFAPREPGTPETRILYTYDGAPKGSCAEFASRLATLTDLGPMDALRVAQRLFDGQHELSTPAVVTTRSDADGRRIDAACRRVRIESFDIRFARDGERSAESWQIAEALGGLLSHVDDEYLRDTFGESPHDAGYVVRRAILRLHETGSVTKASLGGALRENWWFDGRRVRPVRPVGSFRYGEEDWLGRLVSLGVYVERDRFVLGERYGTDHFTRRVGPLAALRPGARLDEFELKYVAGSTE